MDSNHVLRIRVLFICIAAFAFLLVFRLYSVQVVNGDEYKLRADRQYTRPNNHLYDRGLILMQDKNGNPINAATLKLGFLVTINPREINQKEDVYEKLSEVVEIDKDFFMLRAAKDSAYEEILRRVDSEVADKIKNLNIQGVSVFRERWRYYPGDDLAARILGFVAYKEDKLTGRYGLEYYYEDILKRETQLSYTNFFAEVFSNIQNTLSSKTEGDVVTSIEPSVQAFLEKELRIIAETWNSNHVGGIIMDPKTGEIYSMSVYPSFDLNNFQSVTDPKIFSNPLVENVYEMGSVIKPLTMAAGIDSGKINSETKYFDNGFVMVDNRRISNYDGVGRGSVDMQAVLNNSLNTGMVFIVQTIGKDLFAKYMLDFGLGQETGIDLPNETYGLISNLSSPRAVEYATASFGQGIATTPIATVRALSALANGGNLIHPHIGREIKYKSGFSKKIAYKEPKRILKEETSEEITRMLVKVVDEALLEGKVKMEHYSIAAKTGTAQIARDDGGGYYDDRYLHSFFGYFPAYDPKFLVFLYQLEPKNVKYASETLTMPFINIVEFLINYYEVPPDR